MNDNIISINVPNGISILLMGLVGAALLAGIKKAVSGGASPGGRVSNQAQAPGS